MYNSSQLNSYTQHTHVQVTSLDQYPSQPNTYEQYPSKTGRDPLFEHFFVLHRNFDVFQKINKHHPMLT